MHAALAGTYSIVTLVNGAALGNSTHPAVAGGMQWYVDQVLGNATYGSGGSYNLFYTDPSVTTVSQKDLCLLADCIWLTLLCRMLCSYLVDVW